MIVFYRYRSPVPLSSANIREAFDTLSEELERSAERAENLTKRLTPLKICGRPFMELSDLVQSIISGDLLAARQWVADARRAAVDWEQLEQPNGLSEREMAVAAAMAELLASRADVRHPSWTAAVAGEREAFVLDPGLELMPRSFAHAKAEGPEPLRRRNLIALPDFLDVA